MRIIIIGDGKVGHSLAERLIAEEHQVTIVDRNEAVLQRSMDTLDALTVKGSGVSVSTLTEADAANAHIVIAVTISDEINMLACLTAKKLGALYTIARIRDPEYNKSLPFLMKELFIDYVINPERIMAQEISRMLRYPFTGNIETFARGRVEIMDFRITPEDNLAGTNLKTLYQGRSSLPRVLFCAVERDHEALIPKGDFVLEEGDHVFVASDIQRITAFFKALGKNTSDIHRVMIMGASRTAYYLTQMLLDTHMEVTVVEIDEDKAQAFSEMLPGANVIVGDGTDQEMLLSEGLKDMDAFVTLSGRDEENIMSGLYAQHAGVRKVIVKNNRDNYTELLGTIGLDSAVNTKQITSNTILRTVRTRGAADAAVSVERLYRLMDGKVEALEFFVRKDDNLTGVPLKDLRVRTDALVAVIVRDGQVQIPDGSSTLQVGDRVVIIIKGNGIASLSDALKLN